MVLKPIIKRLIIEHGPKIVKSIGLAYQRIINSNF